MHILILLSTSLLSGCAAVAGRLAAPLARSIPDKYQWMVFAVAAVVLAIWNYIEWCSQRRLQSSHKYLVPLLALAIMFCFI